MGGLTKLWRFLIGRPIHSKRAQHERLAVLFALPVFASDALSSTAYASEEILIVLTRARPEHFTLLIPVAIALILLLWTVIFSYFQTIHAYPKGGGSYRVSSQNLGPFAGLMAAAALLIGYILTVAVSVSAGASAIVSMFPAAQPYAAAIASGATALITLINLRGARESGAVFAVPTYMFVVLILVVAGATGIDVVNGVPKVAPDPTAFSDSMGELSGVLLLAFVFKAFAAGCTALTGTEAIADGVLAFKAPEAKNAATTLVLMGVTLSVLFFGVSGSAYFMGITPMEYGEPGYKTVLAQIAALQFGENSALFYASQGFTALILFLAANTGYADFPRLGSFVAADGFLPRQLTSVGDRLVFQNGILTLGTMSIALILIKNADTHQLIPMYAVGVFLSFTLSQAGMVAWWNKSGQRSWKKWVSVAGAIATGLVTLVLLISRWSEGAWITVVALSVTIVIFYGIRRHYDWVHERIEPKTLEIADSSTTVLLLVPKVHRGILESIAYAQTVASDCRALHVTISKESAQSVKRDWAKLGIDMPLVILDSPYRSLVTPIVDYVDQTLDENRSGDHKVMVIVPQAVLKRWYQTFLHSNMAGTLKRHLGSRKNVVIANARYFLE